MKSNRKEYLKKYRLDNKEKIKKYRLDNKEKNKNYQKDYKFLNEEKIKKYQEEYRLNNKEKSKSYNTEYYLNNKEKIKKITRNYTILNKEKNKERDIVYSKNYKLINKEKIRAYSNFKLKNDVLYKLSANIRSLILISFKGNGFSKNSKTYDILGCTFLEFKNHIEMKFKEGMNWDNRGKWHFDHIIPASSAKNEEEMIKLNHYTNFQPLWQFDNLSKGKKIF